MTRKKTNQVEERAPKLPKVAKEDPEITAIIEKLVEASDSRPDAPVGVRVQWVFRNLPKNWDAIDPEGVPDPGAVELLRWAKRDPGQFYQTYDVRFLPSKSEVDRHAMARGSDMDLDRVDGILLEALQRSRAKMETDMTEST